MQDVAQAQSSTLIDVAYQPLPSCTEHQLIASFKSVGWQTIAQIVSKNKVAQYIKLTTFEDIVTNVILIDRILICRSIVNAPEISPDDIKFLQERVDGIQKKKPLIILERHYNEFLYSRSVATEYVELAGRFWAIAEHSGNELCQRIADHL